MKKLKLYLVYIVVCVNLISSAGNETRNSRAYANTIFTGAFIQSTDDKFTGAASWTTGFTNFSNRAVVEFGLNEELHLVNTAFSACVKFDVTITDASLVTTTYTNQQLSINYNPLELTRYQDKAQLVFTNVYKIKVSNIVITKCALGTACSLCATPCTAQDIYVQAEITTDRIYNFGFTSAFAPTDVSQNYNSTNKELEIKWNYVYGAEQYELDYTYVDDYSSTFGASGLGYDLDHDATRIVTTENTYNIPMTYEHGYIVYRLRPIGLSPTKQRIEGTWNASATGVASSAAFKYPIATPFNNDQINWSSIKTFAENGKTGVGVSFSDALGFNRQSIARLNTESKTIVQSTLYDYYGRPTINILPAPVRGVNFDYRFGLNMFKLTSGSTPIVFDKSVFNLCTTTNNLCTANAFTLDPVSSLGAANYYSPSNLNKEAYQGYLPDAGGLPYTQIKYKPDALSRITNQSMAGPTHFLGSGKDLKYFYAQPTQVELDRLFGCEAGRAKYHYKNITIDPNGQTSATYVDKFGRTIATSLLGLNPLNVDLLPNVAGLVYLTEKLDVSPTNDPDPVNRCKEVNTTFFVSSPSIERYYYHTTLGSFASTCNVGSCYNCVYDVELSIKDDCGNEIFDYDANSSTAPGYTNTIGKQPPYVPVTCGTGPTSTLIVGVSLNTPITVTFPKAGLYTVYKKICVSDAPLVDYTNDFITNGCPDKKCQIMDSIMAMTDFSGCNIKQTCAACESSIISYSNASANSSTISVNSGGNQPTGTTPQYSIAVNSPTMTPQQLSQALQNCADLCATNSQCDKYTKKLLADFYPTSGQYASAFSSADPNWAYSIFNSANALSGSPTWSTPPSPTNTYSNAANNPDFVQIAGVNIAPQNLTLANYLANYQKSWAKSFLNKHPERCKLFFYCNLLGSSMAYDDAMDNITHFDSACVAGYLLPINYAGFSTYKPSSCANINNDPITALSSAYTGFAPAINNFVSQITTNFNGSSFDIYKYLAAQIDPSILATTPVNPYTLGVDPCLIDIEWQKFKNLYLTKKQLLYQALLTTFTASPTSFGYSGPCGTVPAGYTTHFPDLNTTLNTNFGPGAATGFSNLASTPPSIFSSTAAAASYTSSAAATGALSFTASLVASANSSMAAECFSACASYTNYWNNALSTGCPAYGAASAAVKNQIIAGLVGVCTNGCDYTTNLGGASTTPTNNPFTLAASGGFTVNSFQQVLNYYLGNNACNAIILNQPAPYPTSTNSTNGITSCKCDQLLQVEKDYNTMAASSTLPPGITAPWKLFRLKYGYDLVDYNVLKCLCKATTNNNWVPGYAWSSAELTSLAQNTVQIDPKLTCETCLKCTDVVTAINALNSQFVSPTTYANVIDAIKLDSTNQLLAINVLNNQFGSHPLQDYLDLYADCQQYNSSGNATRTFSNTITTEALDLFHYLNQLVTDKFLTKNHVAKLCTDSKFFLSSLYTGVLPSVPVYNYNYTIVGNQLNFFIIDAASTNTIVNINLKFPTSYTGTWANFGYLNNFNAYCPTPVAGPNYGFQVQAIDNLFASVTLTGSVVNFVYPMCNLSSGGSPVPTLCPKVPKKKNTCVNTLISNALTQANLLAQQNALSLAASFQENYQNACYNAITETFTRNYNGADEYNFTLYYYDEGGNLQRTIAPKGVKVLNTVTVTLPYPNSTYPLHSSSNGVALNYVNDYQFTSYNQPRQENTVDGGKTKYIYDEVGRIILSQNAAQLARGSSTSFIYSYSIYDFMGRITEVGEATFPTAIVPAAGTSYVYYTTYTTTTLPSATSLKQVTKTYYDQLPSTPKISADAANYFSASGAPQLKNLRNRVVCVTYADVPGPSATNFYNHATFYSYDDHGNVAFILQENNELPAFFLGTSILLAPKFKTINYSYDLVSGNMLSAAYQAKQADAITHNYYYDADNRLHEVFTTKDNINWDRDAKYFYYEHGPLARIERADKQVQGMDYFYTIHGWIKAINSDALAIENDAGKDAALTNAYLANYNNVHGYFAKDAMAYSLNYYNAGTNKDYTAIKNANYNGTSDVNPMASLANLYNNSNPFYLDVLGAGDGASLYNGNISSMVTTFIDKNPTNNTANNTPFPQLTAYRYDQLHRLTKMKSYRSLSGNTWNVPTSTNYDDAYKMNLTYDINGNIKTLLRNGPGSGIVGGSLLPMDNLTYTYFESVSNGGIIASNNLNSNKLACVQDGVANANYSTDIDTYASCTEPNSRYQYDAIGNLIKDAGEYITKIEWTVDRKVKRIIRDSVAMLTNLVTKPDIEYQYNAMRQRVVKIVKPRDPVTKYLRPTQEWTYSYYMYDPSGNVMAVYDRKTVAIGTGGSQFSDNFALAEHHIYGSSRLALARPSNTLATWSYTYATCGGSGSGSTCRTALSPLVAPTATTPFTGYKTSRNLGFKEFELNNHLGNVIATVSDRKVQLTTCNLVSMRVFPPGGSLSDFNPINSTVQILNNQLRVTPTATYSLLDYTIAGAKVNTPYNLKLNIDRSKLAPGGNNIICSFFNVVNNGNYQQIGLSQAIDKSGIVTLAFTPTGGQTILRVVAQNTVVGADFYYRLNSISIIDPSIVDPIGPVVPGACLPGYVSTFNGYFPDLVMHTDYYAFGMEMPGRKWQGTSDKYRYSHNSHEREDAIFEGAQSAEYWMYDSRIGRRWERDPVVKPWESPYMAFSGNPIYYADPKGLDGESRARSYQKKHGGEVQKGEKGNWWVSKSYVETDKEGNLKEIGVTTKEFKDNAFERFGKAVAGAFEKAGNAMNKMFGSLGSPSLGAYVDGVGEYGKRGGFDLRKKDLNKYAYETTKYLKQEFGIKIKPSTVTSSAVNLNKGLTKGLAKHAPLIGHILDAKEIIDGIQADGNALGANTAIEVAGVVGGASGAWAGAVGGVAIGSLIFPGAGTVIGGAIGATIGSWFGEEAAEAGTRKAVGK